MGNISELLYDRYLRHFKNIDIPAQIIINDRKLKGTAFFPGGDGVYKENVNQRNAHPIMVLGQDFDNEANFDSLSKTDHQSEIIGVNNPNKTWMKLLGFNNNSGLDDVKKKDGILINNDFQINPADCFFTNIIMGLRKGNEINHKPSIAFLKPNQAFLKENVTFFKTQLELIKPQLIIGLGIQIPKFIGQYFSEHAQISRLSKVNTFGELDRLRFSDNIVEVEPKFLNYDSNAPLYIVFITHPSFYNRNFSRRSINKNANEEFRAVRQCLDNINYDPIS